MNVKLLIKDNKIILRKGKPAQVGEIRTYNDIKMQKQGNGKWKPVTSNKPKKEPDNDNKKPSVNQSKPDGNSKKEAFKNLFKDAMKGIADIFADLYSGGSGTDVAIDATKKEGENLKQLGNNTENSNKSKTKKPVVIPKKPDGEPKKRPEEKTTKANPKIVEKTSKKNEIDDMFSGLKK